MPETLTLLPAAGVFTPAGIGGQCPRSAAGKDLAQVVGTQSLGSDIFSLQPSIA
jgi:hypothetical protein